MDNKTYAVLIAANLGLAEQRVANTLELLDEGATIPFISRYRKERTGSMDEVQIASINELYLKLQEIAKRKETIIKTITEQGKMTPDLEKRINETWDATVLEDIYLPFKPKRRTRAQVAREQGLEPLATTILLQRERDIKTVARKFVKGDVKDVDMALKGAQDIIAETISENEDSRNRLRRSFERQAIISSKVVKGKEELDESQKFSDYFDWSEPLKRCSSHRLLAMRRGESEGVLRVSISPDQDECIANLQRQYVRGSGECSRLVEEAAEDSYKRLLKPSIETEYANLSKEKADEEAIRVFAENLRQLLLSAPVGQKRVMGIDPGFRTGCKVVCLDAQGNLLHFEAVHPFLPKGFNPQAQRTVERLVDQYKIEAIAIGNGTASRETNDFIKSITFRQPVRSFTVSEDGASVYSASKIARDEFPDQDVTVRGAVSIGRRLMDPLAELVKIDPKSIGVGQYQHDVDQVRLKQKLDQTVESCVNLVGVNLNTASQQLLTYVSGLGPTLAKNIVDYRREHGAFTSRKELLKVGRLGPSAFEQCAGFLRIPDASNPLDNSAVHPESYKVVEQMARDAGCSVTQLISDKTKREGIDIKRYVSDRIGLPTLTDIMKELEKPGRDPRKDIEDRYVKDPNEVVHLHQHVKVRVLEVDRKRNRISLKLIGK